MITKTEKKKLVMHLKTNWIEDVLLELERKGVVNRFGDAYSDIMVRKVLNGYEHQEIESAILKVYAIRKSENDKRSELKSKILSA